MRVVTPGLTLIGLVWTIGALPGEVRSETATLRMALVSQWVVNQHGVATAEPPGAKLSAFRAALDGGVVDRMVFAWQRGVIQRRSLVGKPVRVLAGEEAQALGGRGEFELVAVRPPRGIAAWTEVEIASRTAGREDLLLLEVGGEIHVIRQLLETLFVAPAEGALQVWRLARRALFPGDGIPVIRLPFGQPVAARDAAAAFRDAGGVAVLVARSQVETVVNGDITPNGVADVAWAQGGEWREGDRVLLRVPWSAVVAGAPAVVLGWKDRTLARDPDREPLPRSPLGFRVPR